MTQPTPEFADRPPWAKPGFIAAASLVALILVGGLVVALLPGNDEQPGTGSPPTTAGPADPDRTSPDQADPVGTVPTAVPTIAPDDVSWQLVGQVAVPVSASAGPAKVSGGTAAGYAHTPTGALIAAAQIGTRAGHGAGRASWEPTVEGQFVPGPDRERLLATLHAAGDTPAQPGELSQFVGFQYLSYTPDTAVLGLVMRAPSSGTPIYHIVTLTVRWVDDDWRMVAPPGGSWTALNRRATDLTGVVEWGAR